MDNETQPQQQPGKSNKVPAILLGILVLVIIGGIGVFAMNSAKKDDMTAMNSQPTATQSQVAQPTAAPTTAPSGTSTNVQGAEAQAFTVQGGNFYFKPNEIKVKKGTHVTITFKNDGGFHDFVLDEFNVRTPNVQSGGTATVDFIADKAGTFEYYCSVGNHRQMGMRGNLIVE